ncbi:MAG: hypothetical protein NT076_00925 [Candidatus Pacearchaeota archaeon]|nr:hypothetical protein [Candidatus Pacearchaeota archaeon]
MNKKKAFIIWGIVLAVLIVALIIIFYPKNQIIPSEGFGLNYALLKSVIKQGEGSSLDLKITTLKKEEIKMELIGLESLVYLNEKTFEVDTSKLVRISFSGGASPGVYVGSLYIESNLSNKTIPVILEIQSKEAYFAVSLEERF